MAYGMIVSGTDLQRLQTEVNEEFAKLSSRIKDLEDRAAQPVTKKSTKKKES
jgi:prefoldin subunit 5